MNNKLNTELNSITEILKNMIKIDKAFCKEIFINRKMIYILLFLTILNLILTLIK